MGMHGKDHKKATKRGGHVQSPTWHTPDAPQPAHDVQCDGCSSRLLILSCDDASSVRDTVVAYCGVLHGTNVHTRYRLGGLSSGLQI